MITNNIRKALWPLVVCFFLMANCAYGYSSEAVRYYNQGIQEVKDEQYQKAAENFRQAVFLDSTMNDAYFNLGSVYIQLGENDKAKQILSALFRIDPFDDEAAYVLGGLYLDLGEYENALIYLNTITNISTRYDRARELAYIANRRIKEKELANKKSLRVWQQKSKKGFDGPAGIAADSKGNIYIANYKGNLIKKISPEMKEEKSFTSEKFQGPIGVAVDSSDNLYVSGYLSNNIVRISTDGEVQVIVENIKRPYYLYINDDILHITEQENNSLILINLWQVHF